MKASELVNFLNNQISLGKDWDILVHNPHQGPLEIKHINFIENNPNYKTINGIVLIPKETQ